MIKTPLNKSLLAVTVASLSISSAYGADFYFGEDQDISLQINSRFSVGQSWRVEGQDPAYIGQPNGGSLAGSSTSTDDGNLNYDSGDSFSQIIKGSHDLHLSKDNYGGFVRFKYWSDQQLKNGDVNHGNVSNYEADAPLRDDGFSDNAKFEGIGLLDAYVYGGFDLGEMPLDVRVGRQVLSWGESTFIQGGMNSTNPFDVSALRRPGATLKEGLLPVGMAYASLGATENLSIEAFYQYEWAKTEVDGCGTLFAVDFVADGCDKVTFYTADTGPLTDAQAVGAGVFFQRNNNDIEPDDGGQYGLAVRYFSEALNNTEFGFYAMNIHSRLPMISGYRSSMPDLDGAGPGVAGSVGTPSSQAFVPSSVNDTLQGFNPTYVIEFPEDLKLYGVSFATNVGGVALSGEVSYKPDTPVQINGNHVLASALSESTNGGLTPLADRIVAVEPGAFNEGWDPFDVTQVQVTAIKFIEQTLGASRITLIAEAGATFVDGIEDSPYPYGRNPVFGLEADGADGFATDMSWGYRALAAFDYRNVFAGVSLTPKISWSHDVEGYAPPPGGQFNEGSTKLGLSVEAIYQQTYTASLGYVQFDGGDYNSNADKDFVSLSLGLTY